MKKTLIVIGAILGAVLLIGAGFLGGWLAKEAQIDFEKSAVNGTGEYISEAEAKQIALDKAGLKEEDVRFVRVDFENDDGIYIYDVEFRHGAMEYAAEIKATDGQILGWDQEID